VRPRTTLRKTTKDTERTRLYFPQLCDWGFIRTSSYGAGHSFLSLCAYLTVTLMLFSMPPKQAILIHNHHNNNLLDDPSSTPHVVAASSLNLNQETNDHFRNGPASCVTEEK
jgi:hypothetical protein